MTKNLLGAIALTLALVTARPVFAQTEWPQHGHTIRIIVPWPPGAANDALGRLVAERLQSKLGATAIVENRTGASGLIGTQAVISAAPDGYTLLASAFNTAVMPMVLKGANFDPEVDLEVVARTAVAPLVLVQTTARPQKTLSDVISAAKVSPRDWLFAVSANGSAGHLATIAFIKRTGIPLDMVPYRGTAPALTDVMGGTVQLLMDTSFALLPPALDGTHVRPLAIAKRERSRLAPDVPTFAEAGLPGFEFNSWYGIWAPKGTPRAIQEKINALVQEMMRDPAVVAKLTAGWLEPVAESIDDSKRFIASEIVRSRELLREVNFKPE
jgi:tripartite-type tricarboxylate transporter receptor subunit TctC